LTTAHALPDLLKLLSDPTRLRILALLGVEELAVGELVSVTGLAQSRISNHLALLRRSGLVQDRKEGSWNFYSLVTAGEGGPITPELEAAVLGPFRATAEGQRDVAALDAVRERRRERSRAVHDALADRWVDVGQEFGTGTLRPEIAAATLPRTLVLADLGCGAGYLTAYLAERAAKVIAVDHSAGMLAAARKRAGGDRVELRQGELDSLPIADGEVDAACSSLVWHHLPDLGAAANEVFRILRPGGAVVVADLRPHQEEWMRERMGDHRLGLEPDQVVAALARAGFADLRVTPSTDVYRVERPDGAAADLPLFVVRGERPSGSSGSAPN